MSKDEGDWVKAYRDLLDSQLFNSGDFVFRLGMWCLLKANWKRGWYLGCEILPGQFATGELRAAEQLNVSGSKWRRGIAKLKEMGFIRAKSTNRFTIITVVNWESYQSRGEKPTSDRRTDDDPPTSHRRATDEPPTTIEEGKKGRMKELSLSLSPSDELFSVIPPVFRTNAVEDAVLDWQKKRTDGYGKLIGLDSIELKHALFSLGSIDEQGVLLALSKATQGGWKSLRSDDGCQTGRGSGAGSGNSSRKSISQMVAEAKGAVQNV